MTEKFNLKWNDFHSNVSKSFGLFRNEEFLHDVTLVSDDQFKVTAHKLVLSASSEYFKNIFKNNQHSHPLVCLDGVSSEDLKNITDFIYNGEVMILQDKLDRFLAIAQRLKLQGLIAEDLNTKTDDILDDETMTNEETTETYEQKPKVSQLKVENAVPNVVALNNQDMNEVNQKIQEYLEESSDGSYRCTLCSKTSSANIPKASQKQSMQRHIETHMDGLTYTCPLCENTFRSGHNCL